jgi:hypothetical protein
MSRQPFTNRRPLDPRRCNVAIDANALNRDGSAHDTSVDRLLNLWSDGTIKLITPKGVRLEVLDPRAPAHIQTAVTPMIFTYRVGLNSEEQQRRRMIEQELQGNARPGKHAADADHLFEAEKYCAYFITHDRRILDKAGKMRNLLRPPLTVVTLIDFLEIFDDYEAGRLL